MSNNPFPSSFPRPENKGSGTPHTAATPIISGSYYSSTADVDVARGEQRKRRLLIGGAVAAAVLLLGLGGGTAWAMNAHGDYAYNHIAVGATGYAQLNLDPSMMEQLQAASFLSKLPHTGGKNIKEKLEDKSSVAKAIVGSIAPGNQLTDYSWAGDRYAIAAYGSPQAWSGDDNKVYLFEVKDATKAVSALNGAFNSSYGTSERAQAIGGDFVAVGTDKGLAQAISQKKHLSDDATFSDTYKTAGDPISYWAKNGKQVSTGALRADWNSLKLVGQSTGATVAVSDAAQEANKTLTANNSVANPLFNAGIAAPATVLNSNSPTGKSLLTALGAVSANADTAGLKTQLDTLLGALGDNVSMSANTKGGRLLLHGATEAKIDAALTRISGQKITLRQLLASYGGEDQVKVEATKTGLLFTYGSASTAHPENLDNVAPGVVVGKFDIDAILAVSGKGAGGKWGIVDFSTRTSGDGTQTNAEWVLP